MKYAKPSPTDSLRTAGSYADAEHATLACRPVRPQGVRRSSAFALTLSLATSLFATSLFAVAGGSAASAEGGGLVAAVTKTGYGGHPYSWAAPGC